MAHLAHTHRVRTFTIVMLLSLLSLLGSVGARAFAAPTADSGGSGGSTTIADAEANLPPSSRAGYRGDEYASYAAALQDMEHAGGQLPVAGVAQAPDALEANLPPSSRADYQGAASSVVGVQQWPEDHLQLPLRNPY